MPTIEATGSRHVTTGFNDDGTAWVQGSWSSGAAFTRKDGWLRWGTTGGDFVHGEEDLSKSRKSGYITWELGHVTPGTTLTGKIRNDRFTVKVTD